MNMKYFDILLRSMTGELAFDNKNIIRCKGCHHKLSVPSNRGKVKIRCPNCGFIRTYSPTLLITQFIGIPLLILGGCLSGAVFGYLNHLYDITGLFFFFIIPFGAMFFSALANLGFFGILAFIRMRGVDYPSFLLVVLTSLIALLSFWGGEYIDYSKEKFSENNLPYKNMISVQGQYVKKVEPPKSHPGLFEYVKEKHRWMTFRFGFRAGGVIAVTPETQSVNTGSVGLVLLLLKLGGLFLAFPLLWSITGDSVHAP